MDLATLAVVCLWAAVAVTVCVLFHVLRVGRHLRRDSTPLDEVEREIEQEEDSRR